MSISNNKADRILAIPAFILLVAAWLTGSMLAETTVTEQIKSHLPEGIEIEYLDDNIFILHPDTTSYLVNGWGDGYGGKLRSSIIFSSSGEIEKLLITSDKETPSFIKRLNNKRFTEKIIGLSWESFIKHENLPDVITGATFTSQAILDGAYSASRKYASEILEIDNLPEAPSRKFNWSKQHTILIIVLIFCVFTTRIQFLRKLKARWILILFNLIFLGFWTGNQLSIVQFSRISGGEFPPIGQHLFFYILLAGSILFILVLNTNLYFDRICPFGAAQECLSALSGTKKGIKDRNNHVRWIPRILSLALLMIGLIFRHPSSINYEVFSAFFQLLGNTLQFALLLLVLITSLFVRRPWCHLLCPVRPVLDYIQMIRNWFVQSLKRT